MLQNVYFLAKIGADTAENEQHFAEILPKTSNYPGLAGAASDGRGARGRGVGKGGPREEGLVRSSESGQGRGKNDFKT